MALLELPSVRLFWRRFQREAIRAAEAWLLDEPYCPGADKDALDEALPLTSELQHPETPVDPLETSEAAVDAWTALLVAADQYREVLEAATDRQREVLEAVLGHLDNLDADGAFGGNRYRQVAEAKKRAVEDLGITTVNAIDQHFLRLCEAV